MICIIGLDELLVDDGALEAGIQAYCLAWSFKDGFGV